MQKQLNHDMDQSRKRTKSLYLELTIALVALVSLVSIMASLLYYKYSSREVKALYLSKQSAYADNLRQSFEWPLWDIDDELIVNIGRAIVANGEIASLLIRDDQQRVIFHQEKPNVHQIKQDIPIEHNGKNVGKVKIGLTLSVYEEKNKQLLLMSVATTIMIVIVLLGATRWIVTKLLRKPFDTLSEAIGEVVEGKYPSIELTETYVEFAPILSGFKAMTDAVARRENCLQLSNKNLATEIEERKKAEMALHRLNRELRAVSTCNQALIRAENEQALLDTICRIVCDEAGYRMAWVGYAEKDAASTIRPVAWGGAETGYLAQAGITWADTERGRGPAGVAIRSGTSVCIQDFETDPQAAPWRDNALQRGYRSCISLPLKDESSTTFGILNIYSAEPETFTPGEIRLLEELAGDMAFGITVVRTRAERKLAEEALHLQTVELEEEVAERQLAQENLQEQALLLENEIEERRNAQDELEQLNENLEQRVKQRTIEVTEKNAELEKFNKIFVGRELRMVELKERIKELEMKSEVKGD